MSVHVTTPEFMKSDSTLQRDFAWPEDFVTEGDDAEQFREWEH